MKTLDKISLDNHIGSEVEGFKIVRKIDEGGYTTVYEVKSCTGASFALKVPKTDSKIDSLLKEVDIQADLSHPNILKYLNVIYHEGIPLVLMPLMKDKLDTKKKRSLEEKLNIILQAAEGIKYAHEKGVVHKDVKPSNILEDQSRKFVIADFSIAKVIGEDAISLSGEPFTQTSTFVGTLPYMSPEQKNGEKIDFRTDIYSLTAVLYELLTEGQKADMDHSVFNTLSKKNIPETLSEIVQKGLSSKDDRYKTIDEWIEKIKHTDEVILVDRQKVEDTTNVSSVSGFGKSKGYLTNSNEDLYICDKSGITGIEIFRFADLITKGLLNKKQRREIIEVDLLKYGKNEAEITDYITQHFEVCDSCRGLYQSELVLSKGMKLSCDVY